MNYVEEIYDNKIKEIETFLPDSFKGLSKKYILKCIFDGEIQQNWRPQVGDIIVGQTGNIFIISGHHSLVEELGGDLYFFGGGLCSRDGGHVLDETYCHTMNAKGVWYGYGVNGIEQLKNYYHSSIKDFKFVPYPHELSKI